MRNPVNHKRQDSRRREADGEGLLAVTFDLTHTLIHSPRLAEIYGEVLRRHGIAAKVRDLRREIPWVWQEFSCLADPRQDRFTAHPDGARGWWNRFLRRVCERLEAGKPSRFAVAELFNRFTRADAWEVYPDVVSTLARLRRSGLRLGLVSNWDHRLPQVLTNLGLARYFDAVAYSSDCGFEKPHPRIFQGCLETLAVTPERALHIGDSAIEDAEGALAIGMQAMRIDRHDSRSDLWTLIAPLLHLPAARRAPATGHRPVRLLDAGRHGRS